MTKVNKYQYQVRSLNAKRKQPEEKKTTQSAFDYFKEHPTLALTLGYLLLLFEGGLYNYYLFRNFDINILNYIELNDFLIGAFKQTYSWILIVSIIISIFLFYKFGAKNWGGVFIMLFIMLLAIAPKLGAYLDSITYLRADEFKRLPTENVAGEKLYINTLFNVGLIALDYTIMPTAKRMTYTTKERSEYFNECDSVYLIGSTAKFYFFYHKNEKKTKIINVPNLMKIETVNEKP